MHYLLRIALLVILLVGMGVVFAPSIVDAETVPLCLSRAQERRSDRLVRRGRLPICLVRRTLPSSSASSQASSSSSVSSIASSMPTRFDSLPVDAVRSRFILLGETGPVIAAASIFMQEEPLDVRAIRINLALPVVGLDRLVVYQSDGSFVGAARLDAMSLTGRSYLLSIPSGSFLIDQRKSIGLYLRPIMLSKDMGALPGQTLAVGNIVIEGNGIWSSQTYTKATSESFPTFVTARSVITAITSASTSTAPLVIGQQQTIGSFRFVGRRSDDSARISVTDLTWQISRTGDLTLSNVRVRADGWSSSHACLLLSDQEIHCPDLPDVIGALDSTPRTLSIIADLAGSMPQASLHLALRDLGSPAFAGVVRWTDGSATYDWVDLDTTSVTGTVYRR